MASRTPAKKAAQAPRKRAAAKKATAPARKRSAAPDPLVAAVRAAEAAGQLAVVKVDLSEPLPAELEKALDLRVEINLAATKGRPVQSMAGSDPEVIKLEDKFRRAPKPQPATDGGPVNE